MASLKEVKNRISSVKSTRQITSAMKMVASAKLHKAQGLVENMLPYHRKLNEILANLLSTDVTFNSPYMEVRPVSRVAIVAFSSNTSLCGAYNSNVIKMLDKVLGEYQSLGRDNILLYPVGKKIEEAVAKRGYNAQGSFVAMADKPTYAAAYDLANELMKRFAENLPDPFFKLFFQNKKDMLCMIYFCRVKKIISQIYNLAVLPLFIHHSHKVYTVFLFIIF